MTKTLDAKQMRRQAMALKKESGQPLGHCLNAVAVVNGFRDWNQYVVDMKNIGQWQSQEERKAEKRARSPRRHTERHNNE